MLPAYRIERALRVTHSLNYRYAKAAKDVTTRLRLLPPGVRGEQRLRETMCHFAPLPSALRQHQDQFGNLVLEALHEKVFEHLTFVVELELETAAVYSGEGQVLPTRLPATEGVPPEGSGAYCHPTPLTTPDDALRQVAAGIAIEDPSARAFALCRHVYQVMQYAPGVTTVRTAAAEAWAGRRGVCQDYTHVLLVLCRLAGLPARYVSGFLPGEGAMHAWVEVLLPACSGDNGRGRADDGWAALDPTHDRWGNERYVAVAVGRDYADITPTSGTFIGSGPGSLTHRSRVQVERTTRTPL